MSINNKLHNNKFFLPKNENYKQNQNLYPSPSHSNSFYYQTVKRYNKTDSPTRNLSNRVNQEADWSRKIQNLVLETKNISELEQVILNFGQKFDETNISTAFSQFYKLLQQNKMPQNFSENKGLKSIEKILPKFIDKISARNLKEIVHVYAKLHWKNEELFNVIANASIKKIDQFKYNELSTLAWSFAASNIKHQKLFDSIADSAIFKMKGFFPAELAGLCWAFSALGIHHKEFFNKAAEVTIEKLPNFTLHELANSGWIFSVQSTFSETYEEVLVKILNKADTFSEYTEIEISEFNQSLLVLQKLYRVNIKGYLLPGKIQHFFNSKKNDTPHTSNLHKKIHSCLEVISERELKIEYFAEGFFLDILFSKKKKIAIEINGPTHYLSDGSKKGRDYLKTKILKSSGWKIIEIPYFEWNEAKNKYEYLDQKIRNS